MPPPELAVRPPSATPRSSAAATSGDPMVNATPPKRRINSPCSTLVTRSFRPLMSARLVIQGLRMKLCLGLHRVHQLSDQELEHVAVIPGCLLPPGAHAGL